MKLLLRNTFFLPSQLMLLILLLMTSAICAQTAAPLSAQMADTAIKRLWLDNNTNKAGIPPKWVYDFGVVLNGARNLWFQTGDKKYFDQIKNGIDVFVNEDGTIRTYSVADYNLDQVLLGRSVLLLYRVTNEAKYKKAADLIRSQLKNQPRTTEGGFWHKKIYPNQMWLDGLYMGEPFYAEYAATFNEPADFDDIANQFVWMEKHVRDDKTGLLYHAWDESKKMGWANQTTGRAPMFWGRAMGWYAMALVDVLDYFPKNHPRRAQLIAILKREMTALEKVQDKKSGVWWLILDKPAEKGNYYEASASAMFVYAIAKGVRLGYLPASFAQVADQAYAGIQKEFLTNSVGGKLTLEKTIGGAGLGGNPYRDGSYNYYIGEKVVTNDPKGVGAFLLAAVEMETLQKPQTGHGKTVLLDSFFNNETKKDANNAIVSWHYKWDELDNGGFSLWSHIFKSCGAQTKLLKTAPTALNLQNASVYLIVDPDDEKENPKPNLIEPQHITVITDWVKKGGVLVLMGNDFGNAEFDHFNRLSKTFGIEFNQDSKNHVEGSKFEQGLITVSPDNPVFKTARQLYLKEISTLTLTGKAVSIVQWRNDQVMAISKYGKGIIFAVGDPWLYNEYLDGRKLPAEFENFKAAQDLSGWLLEQAKNN